ncbi:C-terminal processing protease CtpA/Prc [Pontibacter aydingkolensis]|uniref:Peptidase S41 n=1 Tax=Pontibacter aydingkolensis TaxID=1911536 RepID=A0ABS7CTA4_9BACT|nr:S41 family peptidase [Pontibacter aydingkolensis]MBW7467062.1 peptidase S41 [Pontibacter aydingkolensis]
MKLKALLLLLFISVVSHTYAQQDRKIDNATAFTNLYGYVRYFHPSDEAASIDWNRFAIYGQQKVANCKTPQELQKTLTALFQPIAPTVKVYLEGDEVQFDPKELTPNKVKKYKTVAWQHLGLGMGDERSPYKSTRTNRAVTYKTATAKFGSAAKTIDAQNYIGQEFVYKAKVKLADGPGTGHLWARVDNSNSKSIFFDNMTDRPIKSEDWAHYEIKGKISSDATKLHIGAFLMGSGEINLDDISLQINDNGTWKEVYSEKFTSQKVGETTRSFSNDRANSKPIPGYLFTIAQNTGNEEDKWYSIKSEKVAEKQKKSGLLYQAYPKVGEYTSKSIGGGLKAVIPLALYGTENQTYPAADKTSLEDLKSNLEAMPAKEIVGADLYTRLGDITITWNIFQHFYPYFDVAQTDWYRDLRDALARAYTDKTAIDFQKNLQQLTAKLKDGHIRVAAGESKATYQLPIEWEWIEGKLVITDVLDASIPLSKGDIVTGINGMLAEAFFAEVHKHISAATEGWLNHRAKTESLLGEEGTEVRLTVLKPDNSTAELLLKRSLSRMKAVSALPQSDNIKELADGVMYINIDTAPMEEIKKFMPQLQQSKAIICDLRGYPNGNHELIQYLMSSADTSRRWIQIPQIIYPDQEKLVDYEKANWLMKPKRPQLTAKIIFLIDGSAISYAESYMSFIEHYKLATIVGQPTAGTNGNVNPFTLPGGYYISWTGMKVQKHDGSQHHGVGILPNVYVEKTIQGMREGRDEFLEKAMEIATKAL